MEKETLNLEEVQEIIFMFKEDTVVSLYGEQVQKLIDAFSKLASIIELDLSGEVDTKLNFFLKHLSFAYVNAIKAQQDDK